MPKGKAPVRRTRTDTKKKKKILWLETYKKFGANISETCKVCKVGRSTFYEWLDKDYKFSQLVEDAKFENVEMIESALKKIALEGNVTAQIFYLKNNYPERYAEYKDRVIDKSKADKFDPDALVKAMDSITTASRDT